MDGLEIQVLLVNKGQGIPAPPWRDWGSSSLAPRHYRWRARLGRGPYTLEGEIPGSATLLIGCADGTLLPITGLRATGAGGGAVLAGHDGMDFSKRALMDSRRGRMVWIGSKNPHPFNRRFIYMARGRM